MSTEQTYLLRLKSNSTKEIKTTALDIFGTAAKFTSQLTEGYTRKILSVYNNSHTDSGEVVWGGSDVTALNGMVIPKDLAAVDIPISTDLDVYFMNTVSGELGNLRVVESA